MSRLCNCPTVLGHHRSCPFGFIQPATPDEVWGFQFIYGKPEDFVDGADLDTYSERMGMFILGMRYALKQVTT